GEAITGSTGNPGTNTYGIYLTTTGNTNTIDLHDFRLRSAYYAFNLGSTPLTLTHAQMSGNYAHFVGGGAVRLRNVLIQDGTFAFGGSNPNYQGEHVTFHRLTNLRSSSYTTLKLTNSFIIAVTNNVYYSGVNVVSNLDDTGIFQT